MRVTHTAPVMALVVTLVTLLLVCGPVRGVHAVAGRTCTPNGSPNWVSGWTCDGTSSTTPAGNDALVMDSGTTVEATGGSYTFASLTISSFGSGLRFSAPNVVVTCAGAIISSAYTMNIDIANGGQLTVGDTGSGAGVGGLLQTMININAYPTPGIPFPRATVTVNHPQWMWTGSGGLRMGSNFTIALNSVVLDQSAFPTIELGADSVLIPAFDLGPTTRITAKGPSAGTSVALRLLPNANFTSQVTVMDGVTLRMYVTGAVGSHAWVYASASIFIAQGTFECGQGLWFAAIVRGGSTQSSFRMGDGCTLIARDNPPELAADIEGTPYTLFVEGPPLGAVAYVNCSNNVLDMSSVTIYNWHGEVQVAGDGPYWGANVVSNSKTAKLTSAAMSTTTSFSGVIDCDGCRFQIGSASQPFISAGAVSLRLYVMDPTRNGTLHSASNIWLQSASADMTFLGPVTVATGARVFGAGLVVLAEGAIVQAPAVYTINTAVRLKANENVNYIVRNVTGSGAVAFRSVDVLTNGALVGLSVGGGVTSFTVDAMLSFAAVLWLDVSSVQTVNISSKGTGVYGVIRSISNTPLSVYLGSSANPFRVTDGQSLTVDGPDPSLLTLRASSAFALLHPASTLYLRGLQVASGVTATGSGTVYLSTGHNGVTVHGPSTGFASVTVKLANEPGALRVDSGAVTFGTFNWDGDGMQVVQDATCPALTIGALQGGTAGGTLTLFGSTGVLTLGGSMQGRIQCTAQPAGTPPLQVQLQNLGVEQFGNPTMDLRACPPGSTAWGNVTKSATPAYSFRMWANVTAGKTLAVHAPLVLNSVIGVFDPQSTFVMDRTGPAFIVQGSGTLNLTYFGISIRNPNNVNVAGSGPLQLQGGTVLAPTTTIQVFTPFTQVSFSVTATIAGRFMGAPGIAASQLPYFECQDCKIGGNIVVDGARFGGQLTLNAPNTFSCASSFTGSNAQVLTGITGEEWLGTGTLDLSNGACNITGTLAWSGFSGQVIGPAAGRTLNILGNGYAIAFPELRNVAGAIYAYSASPYQPLRFGGISTAPGAASLTVQSSSVNAEWQVYLNGTFNGTITGVCDPVGPAKVALNLLGLGLSTVAGARARLTLRGNNLPSCMSLVGLGPPMGLFASASDAVVDLQDGVTLTGPLVVGGQGSFRLNGASIESGVVMSSTATYYGPGPGVTTSIVPIPSQNMVLPRILDFAGTIALLNGGGTGTFTFSQLQVRPGATVTLRTDWTNNQLQGNILLFGQGTVLGMGGLPWQINSNTGAMFNISASGTGFNTLLMDNGITIGGSSPTVALVLEYRGPAASIAQYGGLRVVRSGGSATFPGGGVMQLNSVTMDVDVGVLGPNLQFPPGSINRWYIVTDSLIDLPNTLGFYGQLDLVLKAPATTGNVRFFNAMMIPETVFRVGVKQLELSGGGYGAGTITSTANSTMTGAWGSNPTLLIGVQIATTEALAITGFDLIAVGQVNVNIGAILYVNQTNWISGYFLNRGRVYMTNSTQGCSGFWAGTSDGDVYMSKGVTLCDSGWQFSPVDVYLHGPAAGDTVRVQVYDGTPRTVTRWDGWGGTIVMEYAGFSGFPFQKWGMTVALVPGSAPRLISSGGVLNTYVGLNTQIPSGVTLTVVNVGMYGNIISGPGTLVVPPGASTQCAGFPPCTLQGVQVNGGFFDIISGGAWRLGAGTVVRSSVAGGVQFTQLYVGDNDDATLVTTSNIATITVPYVEWAMGNAVDGVLRFNGTGTILLADHQWDNGASRPQIVSSPGLRVNMSLTTHLFGVWRCLAPANGAAATNCPLNFYTLPGTRFTTYGNNVWTLDGPWRLSTTGSARGTATRGLWLNYMGMTMSNGVIIGSDMHIEGPGGSIQFGSPGNVVIEGGAEIQSVAMFMPAGGTLVVALSASFDVFNHTALFGNGPPVLALNGDMQITTPATLGVNGQGRVYLGQVTMQQSARILLAGPGALMLTNTGGQLIGQIAHTGPSNARPATLCLTTVISPPGSASLLITGGSGTGTNTVQMVGPATMFANSGVNVTFSRVALLGSATDALIVAGNPLSRFTLDNNCSIQGAVLWTAPTYGPARGDVLTFDGTGPAEVDFRAQYWRVGGRVNIVGTQPVWLNGNPAAANDKVIVFDTGASIFSSGTNDLLIGGPTDTVMYNGTLRLVAPLHATIQLSNFVAASARASVLTFGGEASYSATVNFVQTYVMRGVVNATLSTSVQLFVGDGRVPADDAPSGSAPGGGQLLIGTSGVDASAGGVIKLTGAQIALYDSANATIGSGVTVDSTCGFAGAGGGVQLAGTSTVEANTLLFNLCRVRGPVAGATLTLDLTVGPTMNLNTQGTLTGVFDYAGTVRVMGSGAYFLDFRRAAQTADTASFELYPDATVSGETVRLTDHVFRGTLVSAGSAAASGSDSMGFSSGPSRLVDCVPCVFLSGSVLTGPLRTTVCMRPGLATPTFLGTVAPGSTYQLWVVTNTIMGGAPYFAGLRIGNGAHLQLMNSGGTLIPTFDKITIEAPISDTGLMGLSGPGEFVQTQVLFMNMTIGVTPAVSLDRASILVSGQWVVFSNDAQGNATVQMRNGGSIVSEPPLMLRYAPTNSPAASLSRLLFHSDGQGSTVILRGTQGGVVPTAHFDYQGTPGPTGPINFECCVYPIGLATLPANIFRQQPAGACILYDGCSSGPCAHGGTCQNLLNAYHCTCLPGFTGTRCETDLNECASSPCVNGATCVDGANGFTCHCVPGYTGSVCQTDINECAPAPCQHGGTCTDGLNGYTCACVAGWMGASCQTNIDDCASMPCANAHTCVDQVNNYTCNCRPGFVVPNCVVCDACHTGSCFVNIGSAYEPAGFFCNCPASADGARCEQSSLNVLTFGYDEFALTLTTRYTASTGFGLSLAEGILLNLQAITLLYTNAPRSSGTMELSAIRFDAGGGAHLWVRLIGTDWPRGLAGTTSAIGAFVSAQGTQVGSIGIQTFTYWNGTTQAAITAGDKEKPTGGTSISEAAADTAWVFIAVGIVAGLATLLLAYLQRKYPQSRVTEFGYIAFALFNTATNVSFVIGLGALTTSDAALYQIIAAVFLGVTVLLNFAAVCYIIWTEMKRRDFFRWLNAPGNMPITALSIVLSLAAVSNLRMMDCQFAGMNRFSAPFSPLSLTRITIAGLAGNLLVNLPLLILQVFSTLSDGWTVSTLVALVASALSLAIGLTTRALAMCVLAARNAQRSAVKSTGFGRYETGGGDDGNANATGATHVEAIPLASPGAAAASAHAAAGAASPGSKPTLFSPSKGGGHTRDMSSAALSPGQVSVAVAPAHGRAPSVKVGGFVSASTAAAAAGGGPLPSASPEDRTPPLQARTPPVGAATPPAAGGAAAAGAGTGRLSQPRTITPPRGHDNDTDSLLTLTDADAVITSDHHNTAPMGEGAHGAAASAAPPASSSAAAAAAAANVGEA